MKSPRSPIVRVKVTPEIIAAATARDSQHCMIADAVKAAEPGAKSIAVDLATIRFTDPKRGLRYTYLTPRIAQAQLVRFDQGVASEPFDFVLRRAHITSSGGKRKSTEKKAASKKPRYDTEARRRSIEKARATQNLGKTRLREEAASEGKGTVPDRIGGHTPPLQPGPDGVPFSRRRAFGLRALQL